MRKQVIYRILSPAEVGKCIVCHAFYHPAKTPPLQQKRIHL